MGSDHQRRGRMDFSDARPSALMQVDQCPIAVIRTPTRQRQHTSLTQTLLKSQNHVGGRRCHFQLRLAENLLQLIVDVDGHSQRPEMDAIFLAPTSTLLVAEELHEPVSHSFHLTYTFK